MVKAPSSGQDKSLADIAQNWRSRASENGIKVSSADGPMMGDDSGNIISRILKLKFDACVAFDQSYSEANDSEFITTEEGALFLSHPMI